MRAMSSDQSSGSLDTKELDRLVVTGYQQYLDRVATLALVITGNITTHPGAS